MLFSGDRKLSGVTLQTYTISGFGQFQFSYCFTGNVKIEEFVIEILNGLETVDISICNFCFYGLLNK